MKIVKKIILSFASILIVMASILTLQAIAGHEEAWEQILSQKNELKPKDEQIKRDSEGYRE